MTRVWLTLVAVAICLTLILVPMGRGPSSETTLTSDEMWSGAEAYLAGTAGLPTDGELIWQSNYVEWTLPEYEYRRELNIGYSDGTSFTFYYYYDYPEDPSYVYLKLVDSDPTIYVLSSRIKVSEDAVVLQWYYEVIDGELERRDTSLLLIRPDSDISLDEKCTIWLPTIVVPESPFGQRIYLIYEFSPLDPIFEPVTTGEVMAFSTHYWRAPRLQTLPATK